MFLLSGFYVGFRFNKTVKTSLSVSSNPLSLLTLRENDVLKAAPRGLSNAEMADSLFISVPTVKTHLFNIYIKLGVKRRTQAIMIAQEILVKTENHTLV